MRLTGGRGVEVALDAVGGDVFARSQQALAEHGRLVSVGRSSGRPPVVDRELAKARGQQIVTGWALGAMRTPEQAAEELAQIVELISNGTLRTVVDKVFTLSDAASAHRYLAGRNQFGKVILRP